MNYFCDCTKCRCIAYVGTITSICIDCQNGLHGNIDHLCFDCGTNCGCGGNIEDCYGCGCYEETYDD